MEHLIGTSVSELTLYAVTGKSRAPKTTISGLALQLQRANAGKNIYLNGISHPFASDNRELSLHHFQLTEKTRICSTLSGSILLVPFITTLLRNLGIRGLKSFLKGWKSYIIEHRQSLFDAGNRTDR